jgi:hypothetical protein
VNSLPARSPLQSCISFSICYVYARKDEALRSSYMTPAEAVVIAEAIAKLPGTMQGDSKP